MFVSICYRSLVVGLVTKILISNRGVTFIYAERYKSIYGTIRPS